VTCNEQRPHREGEGAGEPGRSSAEGTAPGRLDEPELLAEAGRLLAPIFSAARHERGRIVGVGEAEWWRASDAVKRGGLATLALAWMVHDPEQAVRERIKAMAVDLSQAHDWSAESRRPSHTTLAAIRDEPGPMARTVDPVAARRWVATGTSVGGAA